MKYVVIEHGTDGATYYGPFYLERMARAFIAASPSNNHTTYEISVIYQSRELTQRINSDILDNQEGTSYM